MENFAERLNEAARILEQELSGLSDEQFNWKPAPESWSIAQCILHLVKTNKGYFPVYERLASGEYAPNFWEKLGIGKSMFARFFVEGVDPKNIKKMKAPGSIRPGKSHIDQSIRGKLLEQHAKMLGYHDSIQTKNEMGRIVSSPFANIITYPVSATFDIVCLHELRHLQQALRVKNHPGFPK